MNFPHVVQPSIDEPESSECWGNPTAFTGSI
jgi:hypothetical protein